MQIWSYIIRLIWSKLSIIFSQLSISKIILYSSLNNNIIFNPLFIYYYFISISNIYSIFYFNNSIFYYSFRSKYIINYKPFIFIFKLSLRRNYRIFNLFILELQRTSLSNSNNNRLFTFSFSIIKLKFCM